MPEEKNTERRVLPPRPLSSARSSFQRIARWQRLWSLIVTLSRLERALKFYLWCFLNN